MTVVKALKSAPMVNRAVATIVVSNKERNKPKEIQVDRTTSRHFGRTGSSCSFGMALSAELCSPGPVAGPDEWSLMTSDIEN